MTGLRSDDRRDLASQKTVSYALHVDGEQRTIDDAWIGESLLFVLRERAGVRTVKAGCGSGQCGACTLLMDGRPGLACLILAAGASGSTIVTAGGLDARADAVRRALVEFGGVQCGVCAPAYVIAVNDLLARHTYPDERDIVATLAGVSCPCGAAERVLDAVRALVSER